jgi:hypothetical protein
LHDGSSGVPDGEQSTSGSTGLVAPSFTEPDPEEPEENDPALDATPPPFFIFLYVFDAAFKTVFNG